MTRCLALVLTGCGLVLSLLTTASPAETQISGALEPWHCVTFTFDGPETSETAEVNPFLDYRLDVTFTCGDQTLVVPGFYAADGNAAETSASSGNKWRVRFMPTAEGVWTFKASFRKGENVAIAKDPGTGEPAGFDGASGKFRIDGSTRVGPSEKDRRDFRKKGMLEYVGQRYRRFAESGEYFLKMGADSPENFLAYFEFDGDAPRNKRVMIPQPGEATPTSLFHRYDPHVQDWNEGDPTWQGGRGKGIIGALNYLASKGVNSVYFLTMNVGGDGRDVWPWTTEDERYRFDCSKLDQWEIVFRHMTARGIMLHVLTQETENDQLLDGGDLGPQRKLYYRELIARFGHHPAVTWNLGEENTNTTAQIKAFSKYFADLDPYDHLIVVHTYPGQQDKVYEPLLGWPYLTGVSLQTNQSREQAIRWIERSQVAGHPWVVTLDEIGPAHTGVKPDADDPSHDEVRTTHLWPVLMAGGAGVEWYFGYKYAHNDLNCEDFRSRDAMWDQTRRAVDFFKHFVPFTEMVRCDALTGGDNLCFARPGELYLVYRPHGAEVTLNLGETDDAYNVMWCDPTGGMFADGTRKTVRGPGLQSLGSPPPNWKKDVVAYVVRQDKATPLRTLDIQGGVGGGTFAPGAAVPVKAVSLDPTLGFAGWEGDIEGLEDPNAAETILIMPDEEVMLRAKFEEAPPIQGAALYLFDTRKQKPIGEALADGVVLSLSELPSDRLTIVADVPAGVVQSVAFEHNGESVRREREAPYSLGGDTAGVFAPTKLTPGAHTVRATLAPSGDILSVTFRVEP